MKKSSGSVSNRRVMAVAQRGMRRDLKQSIASLTDQVRGTIMRFMDIRTERVQPADEAAVRRQVRIIVMRFFVSPDSERPFTDEGAALAEFPRILNKWYLYSVLAEVRAQRKWMERNIPSDVLEWLRAKPARPITEQESPFFKRDGESFEVFQERLDDLRIFRPNPLAELDPSRRWVPMHRWNTDDGYRLSDRLWNVADETRRKIDQLIVDGFRQGRSAVWIANRVVQFLSPDAAKLRTKKPYGRDGSMPALRLARTEIARAANHAAYISGYLNPYTSGIDVARSAYGDVHCPICPDHATIDIYGRRTRPPYAYDTAYIPPYHPHDMCHCRSVVTDTPDAVTARLRAAMQDARGDLLSPVMSPLQEDAFVQQLVGSALMNLMAQVVQLPLL